MFRLDFKGKKPSCLFFVVKVSILIFFSNRCPHISNWTEEMNPFVSMARDFLFATMFAKSKFRKCASHFVGCKVSNILERKFYLG